MSVVSAAATALFQVKSLTFVSVTAVAPQPLLPQPSATVLHNRAVFLFFPTADFFLSLASNLIWEKSERGSRQEPAVDEQRVEQFLSAPEVAGRERVRKRGGRGGYNVFWPVRILLRRRRGFFSSPLFFSAAILHSPGRERSPLTHTHPQSAFSLYA